jgi:hypothetical protein
MLFLHLFPELTPPPVSRLAGQVFVAQITEEVAGFGDLFIL